jgi:hypothetical protein
MMNSENSSDFYNILTGRKCVYTIAVREKKRGGSEGVMSFQISPASKA